MKLINYSFLMAIFLSMTTTPSIAEDGATNATPPSPPSNSEACEDLQNNTPGLYGLCVAYCGATDSPTDLSTTENVSNLPVPSARILFAYDKKKKDSDPQMPCATYYDEEACPAWTREQLNFIGTLNAEYRVNDGGYGTVDNFEYYNLYELEYGEYIDPETGVRHSAYNGVQVYGGRGGHKALYRYSDFNHSTRTYEPRIYNVIEISIEQAQACFQEILDHSN